MVKFFTVPRDSKIETVKEQLIARYGNFTLERGEGIIAIANPKKNEFYIAYKFVAKNWGYRTEVQCLVVTVKSFNKKTYTIQERWEEFAPKHYNCPKSILDLLTAPKSSEAVAWRKECLSTIRSQKEKVKKEVQKIKNQLQKGKTIIFNTPIVGVDGKKVSKFKITSTASKVISGRKAKVSTRRLITSIKKGKAKVTN